MTRYSQEQIEDVAELLRNQFSSVAPLNWIGHIAETETNATVKRTTLLFADLFAADNPHRCIRCGVGDGAGSGCLGRTDEAAGHTYQGFDRARFLKACRLDSA